MKPVTKHKAEVYSILVDLMLKTLFALIAIGVFVAVAVKMLYIANPTWESVGPYAAFDTLLGGTVFIVFRHYFPSGK
ncbi:hypothetical protein SAMN05428642_101826 [Flaviramulus basaltis]|uniref:Uncharacterized protein n=1 Tax=Flaviramulus basaltis TaxID=369401 RepID=A0A1K2IDA1_9FLAO|nr:hypothetical protein [Flaviramulus basaltis]SFZ90250.1 hypothetical protein SAMN05428642_101826 [Flaviramulus basaltis]